MSSLKNGCQLHKGGGVKLPLPPPFFAPRYFNKLYKDDISMDFLLCFLHGSLTLHYTYTSHIRVSFETKVVSIRNNRNQFRHYRKQMKRHLTRAQTQKLVDNKHQPAGHQKGMRECTTHGGRKGWRGYNNTQPRSYVSGLNIEYDGRESASTSVSSVAEFIEP